MHALSDSLTEPHDDARHAKQLAADLDEERRKRQAAEDQLEQVRAKAEQLAQREREFEAAIHNLHADVELADERAAEFENVEQRTAELQGQVEEKDRQLESLAKDLAAESETLAKLQEELAESQQECAAAYRRIEVLKDPEDLDEIARR